MYKHFKSKNTRIKIRYVAYHDPNFFFIIYLAYVNMSIVHKEFFLSCTLVHGSRNFKKYIHKLCISNP